MGRRGRALIVALLLLPLAGCIRGVAISISGPLAAPVVTMRPTSLFEPGKVCLTELSVGVGEGGDVWRARTRDLKCPDLNRITYGAAPASFETLVTAKPLRAGVVYTVDVRGSGWMGRQGVVFERGRWRTR